jgi:nucleoside-diphosphate-sugar epimerase
LKSEGHEVFALRRDVAKIPPAVDALAADLCDLSQLARVVPNDLTHVAYCAAADARSDEAYERAYVIGLSNVLSLRQLAHCRRVAFISSTAVYAQDDDSWVDEASPTEPSSFSGQRTLQAEARLVASGLPYCIFRCAGIYGPGRKRLIDQVRSGAATYDPERAAYTNRIHSDDVAQALARLLQHPDADGVVLGVDDEPARRRDVLQWLATRMGAPRPTADPRAATARAGSKRVSNRRLRGLGYEFIYPTFREGYDALLRGLERGVNPGDLPKPE